MPHMMGDRVDSDPGCYGGFGFWLHSYGPDYLAPVGTPCKFGCGHVLDAAELAQRERNEAAALKLNPK